MRVRRVAAVVPCFNRRKDAEDLLGDLAQIDLCFHGPAGEPGRVDLRVLLVDNCSTDPLHTLTARPPVSLEHLRLPDNLGGAGGYNAGMKRVLGLAPDMPGALVVGGERGDPASRWHEWDPEYVWLVDSDARVGPATLRTLLEVLEVRTDAVASGSAICDPQTGQAFELGGHVNRANGNFEPYVIGNAGVRTLVECDYLAACCALVRSEAIRDTGVFPERFLNGDDVEWFIRMKGATGRKILGVPWSEAMHPRFDRFPTWQRYYMTRNCFGPIHALGRAEGATRRLLFKRALRDVPRAVQQEMMGRNDLAKLQRVALKHAGTGLVEGPAPKGLIKVEPSQPFSQLAAAIKGAIRAKLRGTRPRTVRVHQRLLLEPAQVLQIEEQIRTAGLIRRDLSARRIEPGVLSTLPGALARLIFGPPVDVAIVPARGRPEAWFSGRLMVEVTTGGFVIKKNRPIKTVWRAMRTGLAGVWNAGRVALCPGQPPTRRARRPIATPETLTLGAVVLSYNRWTALKKTVESLREAGVGSIVVVDNASTDGSAELIEQSFPEVRLVRLEENLGVEAFNRGVAASDTDVVLLLDDDARPAPGVLEQARALLARRPDLAAVTLHPRHPADDLSEWPFAERLEGATSDEWPVMGCANLVRRRDWDAVGGYEAAYFLYRNDTDLALKLLARGRGVHFSPAWVVHHDSPAGAGGRKSVHWHERATRNWIWTARRHGRGWTGLAGGLLGWLWAHKLAGSSTKRHAATLRGARAGWFADPPRIDPRPDGSAYRAMLRMLVRR
jgi:GT2 family glycosyltransferase